MIGIGLFGQNGHQLPHDLVVRGGQVVATCGIATQSDAVVQYASFTELLADPAVHLVSICAPRRDQQVFFVQQALRAGKHVYAEKPCVMRHDELDRLITLAQQQQCYLFEMAGTAFEAPYAAVTPLIASGILGTIGQIVVRKSYPYADWRPQDEGIDGGLIMQAGIHAARLITHVAQQRIVAISAVEHQIGNPVAHGDLQMAVGMLAQLANGGCASIYANYYNQRGNNLWGDDELRIYGSQAFLYTVGHTIYVVDAHQTRQFDCAPQPAYIQRIIDVLHNNTPRPLDIATEIHPTHVVIAAKQSALHAGMWVPVPAV